MATKKHTKNAEWINNVTKELEGLGEGLKTEIHINLFKMTQKKDWQAQSHDGMHGFWFLKFTSTHEKIALEINRRLQRTRVPEWITKRKATLIQEDSKL